MPKTLWSGKKNVLLQNNFETLSNGVMVALQILVLPV